MSFEKISTTFQIDRQLIPDNIQSERYILLNIQVPTPPQKMERLPLNLSLVIDRSGSMRGDKLEYVKEAAIHALRLLTEHDRVSVVIYDDEVQLLSPSQGITAEVRNKMITDIRQITPGGMTNLSGGWFTGSDQIADYITTDYLNRALLLTDGLANKGLTDHEQLVMKAKELRKKGVSSTTFGVGNDFNQFLLQGIADAGGGHFYFIDKPNQIPNYFEGELGEMLTTVVREMTVQINLPSGIEVTLLNDTPFELTKGGIRFFLGDAYAGESRILVFKVKIPSPNQGQTVSLPFTVQYEAVQQQRQAVIIENNISFNVAGVKDCEAQEINEQVLKEAGAMEIEWAKMKVLKHRYEGNIAQAKNVLQQAKKAMVGVMPAIESQAVLEELDNIELELEEKMTARQLKEKHYATYRKQKSRADHKK